MYYIGTKAECEAYDAQVTQGQGYDGVYTVNWANPIAHPNGTDFAIVKHPDYDAGLTTQETLGSDWFPQNI